MPPPQGTTTLNAIIMSILCTAPRLRLQCRIAAPGRTHVAAEEQPIHQPVEALSSGFRFGGIDRRKHVGEPLAVLAHASLHSVGDVAARQRRTITLAVCVVIVSWAARRPHFFPPRGW